MTKQKKQTGARGFASMSEDTRRQIASKGGKAAHERRTAHEWNSEEAQKAGRKGGQHSRKSSKNDTYVESS
ncbi:MAG: KGG domain-containing protein [Patescibacteria group bacterium]